MMKVLLSIQFSDELTETEKLIKMIVLVMGSNGSTQDSNAGSLASESIPLTSLL